MMQFGLTPVEQKLLTFISDHLAERGVSPSYDEMCLALGLKSKSNTHRLVEQLITKGHIAKLDRRARSIVVIGSKGCACSHCGLRGEELPTVNTVVAAIRRLRRLLPVSAVGHGEAHP